MTGTGRLVGELGLRTRRVIYGDPSAADLEAELDLMTQVDQAHLVMLAECKLIPEPAAAALLGCIEELRADRFAALAGRPAPRGLFLMYEGYLIDRLGSDIGGQLHTARSRNDLKATITALRLREWLLDLTEQATRLEAILLNRARAYQSVVMPIYTHFQAAMPISYGYYLLGVALALGREIDALRMGGQHLSVCPLGANAVAGGDLPIDPDRTAALLGFTTPVVHALDAVASRDVALRLLASAAGVSVLLSRLATDMQLWSTVEFGFLAFPDRLVGGSSAMPQKRNAFLLEHVKAKPGHVVAAWAGAASMSAATPFTNSIEVGTEAVGAVWPGLRACLDSVLLSQVLVSGARPASDRMVERARTGFTAATAVANRLVSSGVAFRTAHHMVGEAVRRAVEAGSTDVTAFGPPGWLDAVDTSDLDLAALVRSHRHGGGPGAFTEAYQQAHHGVLDHCQWQRQWRRSIATSAGELATAVQAVQAHRGRP